MATTADDSRVGATAPTFMMRWPTGAKLLVILSIALLPLAIIAVFATLRITQIADTEARAGLRVASAESGRAIAIELIGDMTALRAAVDALESDPHDAPSCARVQGVFAQQAFNGARFAVFGARGRLLCGSSFPGAQKVASLARDSAVAATIDPDEGLLLGAASASQRVTAAAFFPTEFLAELSRPSSFTPSYAATLSQGDDQLVLQPMPREAAFERREGNVTDLGIGGLKLAMEVRTAPITSPLVIALLLPLVMWAAAAGIAWFVVDRLLIRPLRRLRANVAAFTPGEEPDPTSIRMLPAQELRELGETFRALTRTVAIHEAGLAEGLVRQTKLTREVHHRVKNNLQVISSLINFHARGAKSPEAAQAYASIQRRVDALAVVHRNHFAEMEENRGLGLRSMLGELASNIRATAAEGTQLGIQLDIDLYLVSQDVAVAVAFLVTELIELAVTCDPAAQLRVSVKEASTTDRATLRVSSRALIEGVELREGLATRFGRVIEGLSRQLRAPLHHDPLTGAYEITIAVLGRD
ncbi:sensor histidine kinase [Sphingomonas jeddahensis]|uniref:histidine kinase n=1 Tax=Sphingomonas jeddahensis TaxID=1915074 RepID=A0A1V2EV98_9SPHN|nr:histidine kinase dimerization/phosphoacceptor domain -containing protein [Sphingomonas jeddahensis]ONF96228.1 putative sensor histidine kinase pdtaS [Sphingomonas jeddahensis]